MIRYLRCDKGFNEVEEWFPGCWVNVTEPTPGELKKVQERFGIPEDFVDDISDPEERPHIETDSVWTLAIIRIPRYEPDSDLQFNTAPMGVMVKDDVIVTICNFDNDLTVDFIDHTQRRNIEIPSAPDFILRLLNSSAYWFMRYMKAIKLIREQAEDELERSIRNEDLLQLLQLQKALVLFATAIKGNLLVLERLRRMYPQTIGRELLEDVEIELRQADSTVEVANAMFDRTLDTYANVISNNVNAIMKRLTSISVILMVPTLIASFYGMNVDIGISSTNTMAFWVIIGVAILLTVLACVWLKRIHWL